MPKRLWVKSISSVGAVDAGDDPEAVMTFWKRKTTDESGVDDRKAKNMPDEFSLADLPLSDEQAVALDEHIAGVVKAAVDEAAIPLPIVDEVDVFKNLDDEGKAALEELRKQADKNASELAEEIAKRRAAEFVTKAEPYKGLVGDDGAEVLAGLPDETATVVLGWLSKADEQIKAGNLFKVLGSDGEGDVEAEKAAFVKQYRADHPGEPVEKANAEFWKLNPDAIERSREGK